MTWVAAGVAGASLIGGLFGASKKRKAANRASRQLQANINRGLERSEKAQSGFEYDLNQGQIGGLRDLSEAGLALERGSQQQQGFLNQAAGQFGQTANLTAPAIANLQRTGTASGRAQELTNVLSDPNQQGLFNALSRQTQNQLSGMGGLSRRSGFGIGQDESARLNLANQLVSQQDLAQQNLSGMGIGAQRNLANIFSQQGSAAANQGISARNLLGQSAAFRQQGGANLATLGQQGLANELNLIGQLGQAQAAGTIGAANAQAQGLQSIADAGFGLASSLAAR